MSPSAPPIEPRADDYSTVELSRLRVGATLFAPIFDVRDVLLLAEGQPVTDSFLERLRGREIRSVRAHGRDVASPSGAERTRIAEPLGTAVDALPHREGYVTPFRNETSDRLDAEVGLGRLELPKQGDPLLARVRRHDNRPYDPAVRDRLVEAHRRAVANLSRVYERLAGGGGLDRATLDGIADEALTEVVDDIDLFAAVGGNPGTGDYPVRHSVNTSMLAVSIGVHLGLDAPTLRELAIGCLVHDAGMLWLDRRIYDHPGGIDPVRFLEITKHPILVFDVLKDQATIPKRSAFIAYQMHERCDGSGYPRRRTASQIHFLSKIAAVADSYVALVSPRPHRPALMPYRAMERVLRDANRGLYDRGAVRALLRTLSLFPVGSYVELSDGRRGRILRSGSDYCRPVVQIGTETDDPETLDLAAAPALSVTRAVVSFSEAVA